VSTPVVIGRAA